MTRKFMVSVVGVHKCDEATAKRAEKAGKIIAETGSALVTGGLAGVMEAACRGARKAGGLCIGFIPGEEHSKGNRYLDIVIPTGMGFSRNTLVAGCADMVLAFEGAYGTLSEMAFALVNGIPVFGLDSWDLPDVKQLRSLDELKVVLEKIKRVKAFNLEI